MSSRLQGIVVLAFLAFLPLLAHRSTNRTADHSAQRAPSPVGQEHAPRSAWSILREAHDADGDGKLAASEYHRSERVFERMDFDGDGWITEADLSSPARDRRAMESMMGDVVGFLGDHDKDRTVTLDEWRATLATLDSDDTGIAGPQALSKAGLDGPMQGGIVYILDRDRDGNLQVAEMEALFRRLDKNGDEVLNGDEIVNWHPSHLRVGDPAPLFELPRVDDFNRTVRLADFREKRPVALIFGSHT
jgi:hypothetical protein